MKYYIQRQLQEYGPYTLADLQRYVAQGTLLLTDLTRSEGMTEWTPLSQVLGNIPPPTAPAVLAATGTVYAGTPAAGTVYGGAPAYGGGAAAAAAGPMPPDFHWALVLLISFFCSIFQIVWLFIEASFVKKIKPDSNFLTFLISSLCLSFGSGILYFVGIVAMAAASGNNGTPSECAIVIFFSLFGLVTLSAIVLNIIGVFKMRRAMLDYYNTVEPINLRLSGVMTFFFALFYFQYHFSRIAAWKKTGYLTPQQ